jgi:pilus assembly protein CpaE
MFQLMPPWTIYDAAEHIEGLDGEALRGYLSPHRSGVYLLPAPVEPSLAEAVSSQAVIKILRLLKDSFPYVVVDCPSAYNDQVLAALDESDAVVLIASMEVPGIKSLKLALQTLEQLGVSRERIRIVLNRADSKVGLRLQEVEKTLGSSVDIALPSTIRVPQSVNRGVPIAIEARNSSVVVPIAKLARSLIASTQGTRVEPSRWGFLRRG